MENYANIDSKFRLVILAAKRAKQLLKGGRKRIPLEAENPLTIALEEIGQGLVDFEITDGTPRKPDLSIFGDEEGEPDEVAEASGEGETASENESKEDSDNPLTEPVTPDETDLPPVEESEEDVEVQPATE